MSCCSDGLEPVQTSTERLNAQANQIAELQNMVVDLRRRLESLIRCTASDSSHMYCGH